MKSSVTVFMIQAFLIFLLFNLSCFSGDGSEDEENWCDVMGTLDGRTFESDLGSGTFAFPTDVPCSVLFFTYRDGEITIRRHPGAGHMTVDRAGLDPGGDVWAFTRKEMWIGATQDEALWQLHEDEWIDWSSFTSWLNLSSIHFVAPGAGYILLYSRDFPYETSRLLKTVNHGLETVELPDWDSAFGAMSSADGLLALHATDEYPVYPKGTLFVLRNGSWEEGLAIDEMPEEYRFGGIAIVGDGEFWMWTQEIHQEEYKPNPWRINSYENGGWQEIHQVDFSISGVLVDGDGRRVVWGHTGNMDELGDYNWGHGRLAIFDGTQWTETVLETGDNPNIVSYASIDSEGNVWLAGFEEWSVQKETCTRTDLTRPFFARFAGGEWSFMDIPEDVENLVTRASDNYSCGGPE